jgi:hypothetical protein
MSDDLLPEPSPAPAEVRHIGNYRLVERVGEGGMAVVYRAEQVQHVQRVVALKVAKFGIDSDDVVKRFEAERQTLASLDHPNIARLYDAGVTDAGRPYFVLEYVDGQSITEWCRTHGSNLDARLRLFVSACRAVQHAHSRGVIHRDLKPSNVLVAGPGDSPMLKVIDFGIAKAIGGDATPGMTRSEARLGTPAYMSPEQTAGDPVDVRFDVYALGVILAELLTGRPPFDLDAAGRPVDSTTRIRPSTRLHPPTRASELPRLIFPESKLRRRLRDELDWIVLKAIEPRDGDRYATVRELLDDVERFLRDEPTRAGKPGRLHRVRRFARSHPLVVYPLAALFAVLIGLLGWMGWERYRYAQLEREIYDNATVAMRRAESGDEDAIRSVLGYFGSADGNASWRGPNSRELYRVYVDAWNKRLAERRAALEDSLQGTADVRTKLALLEAFDKWLIERKPIHIESRFWALDSMYALASREFGPTSPEAMQYVGDLMWWSLFSGRPARSLDVLGAALPSAERGGTREQVESMRLCKALALQTVGTPEAMDEAKSILETLASSTPGPSYDQLTLGDHAARRGDYAEAVTWARRARRAVEPTTNENAERAMAALLRQARWAQLANDAAAREAALTDAESILERPEERVDHEHVGPSLNECRILLARGRANELAHAITAELHHNRADWPGDGIAIAFRLLSSDFDGAAAYADPSRLGSGYDELIAVADELADAHAAAGRVDLARRTAQVGLPYARRSLGAGDPVTLRLARHAGVDASPTMTASTTTSPTR